MTTKKVYLRHKPLVYIPWTKRATHQTKETRHAAAQRSDVSHERLSPFHAAQGCIERLDEIVELIVASILEKLIEKVRRRTSNKELIPSKEEDADQNRIDLNFGEIHEEVKAPNNNTMEIFCALWGSFYRVIPYDCIHGWDSNH